ncbi:MAG: ion transporter [Ruthenibacterium sp.]
MMREIIYKTIKKASFGETQSRIYDYFITVVATLSIVPLLFKGTNVWLEMLDLVTVYLLFLDYVLRWIVADYLLKKPAPWAFVQYPITPFALIDLVSLLPSLGLLHGTFRILRMLRVFKILNYSKTFSYVINVFHKQSKMLGSVLAIAIGYIFISGLAMFSYEPDTFDSFFEALYWATTALTTVGYGDVYPLTNLGKLISMISSLFGIAVIAMPASIVTAGFIDEMQAGKAEEDAQRAAKEETHNV